MITIPMKAFPLLLLMVALPACADAGENSGVHGKPRWIEHLLGWFVPELPDLKKGITALDRQIAGLPSPVSTNSTGSAGFMTVGTPKIADHWVEMTLRQAVLVERVVLVPTLLKAASGDMPGFGFPVRFILEGVDKDGNPTLLMDQTTEDFTNPGLFPVAVDCPQDIKFKIFRLTATRPWSRGGPYLLSLSEIMLLRGNLNVATNAVISSSSSREFHPTWSRRGITDMATPLGLPVNPNAPGEMGWHSQPSARSGELKSFTVDLGKSWPLDVIRLVPCSRPGFFAKNQYGFPARFILEVSENQGFLEKSTIADFTEKHLPTPGQNLKTFGAGRKMARYVRMTSIRMRNRNEDFAFAMAEVQAYSGGVNRALGAKVIAEESLEQPGWSRAALTDGHTSTGLLLELPQWIDDLKQARYLIARRNKAVTRRKSLLRKSEHSLVVSSVGVGTGIAILGVAIVWRSQRRRLIDRERLRERLARDLHDELGSNLGSIALISSFADQADDTQMRLDLAKIENVARESADSMRDMVSLLGGKGGGTGSDWLRVMSESAKRSMHNVELDLQVPAAPLPRDPTLETRREIYLFCKEVLHNANRHSKATRVTFSLSPTPEGLSIEITDNGLGFQTKNDQSGHGLGNLRERAAMMKGKMSIESMPGAGTIVTLDVPRNRRWMKRTNPTKP